MTANNSRVGHTYFFIYRNMKAKMSYLEDSQRALQKHLLKMRKHLPTLNADSLAFEEKTKQNNICMC